MDKKGLLLEFLLLCVALPTVIIAFNLAPYMFPLLWAACAYCFVIYRRQFFESWARLWRWDQVTWSNLKPILVRWALASLGIALFTWGYEPERLFYLPRNNPEFLLVLIFAYTALSALPQEFIFCSFFFKRYAPFFKSNRTKMIASAAVFAYAHMLFINWIAPVFSFMGGLIFADTYLKTRSLALITIEHGLYGNSLFIIGLGWYFYTGSIGAN